MRWSKFHHRYIRILHPKQASIYPKCLLGNKNERLLSSNCRFIPSSSTLTRHKGRAFATKATSVVENFVEADFFEEPITFLLNEKGSDAHEINETLLSYNTFVVQYVTRGKASNDGGDEFGISAKAAHSTAIPWSEILIHMSNWCQKKEGKLICTVPMLACASISPLIAIGGLSYLRHLDESYLKSMPNSLSQMAEAAVLCLFDDEVYNMLSERERYHLQALDFLLRNDHQNALKSMRTLLEMCPGDALGLSLAMDISASLSDKHNAFQSATSVASYWNERGQRSATGQTAIPGFTIGSSLIALGLAVGGRYREAEQLVDVALSRNNDSSGVCAWALANIYDCEGRVGEGSSTLTSFGVDYYETCGLLFTDSMLAGIGGRFVLDRDGATADNVAIRLYDEYFGRVLEYSGYVKDNEEPVIMFAPKSHRKMVVESATGAATSVLSQLFGRRENGGEGNEDNNKGISEAMDKSENETNPHTLADIFAWLPPHSGVLMHATLLLFRLTTSGAVSVTDERWTLLKIAWEKMIRIEKNFCDGDVLFKNFPLSRVASLLILGETHFIEDSKYKGNKFEHSIVTMGGLMNLSGDSFKADERSWANIVRDLSDFRKDDGGKWGWDLNFGNFLEHSICHSALQTNDYEALCIAKSICSESIALKSNSPETWFRYGLVLEKLGDEENAQNAFKASVSLGAGEGGRINPT